MQAEDIAAKVPQIRLNDGKQMPQIGLGVWQVSDAETEIVCTSAIATGYRLIDTAAIYRNETGVGAAMAAGNQK